MNIRHLPLLGSLFFSGLLTLGACGSSSSSGSGGTPGSLGGTTGATGGTTGSFGGAGGHVGATGGTVGPAGGTTGSAGGTIGSAGGSTGTCSTPVPSCIQPLLNCGTVSGTCVRQMTGSAATGMYGTNVCYSNGVKQTSVVSVDLATQTGSINITVSKGGTVCYTESETQTDPNQEAPVIVKNSAGTTVATLSTSADGTGIVVTCPGQAAVTIADDCMPSGMTSDTTGDCTDGVCQ